MEVPVQPVRAVKLEQSFAGHYPVEKRSLRTELKDEYSFDFEGIGFAINASIRADDQKDHVPQVEVYVDGKHVETVKLPSNQTARRFVAFWRYQLPEREAHRPTEARESRRGRDRLARLRHSVRGQAFTSTVLAWARSPSSRASAAIVIPSERSSRGHRAPRQVRSPSTRSG